MQVGKKVQGIRKKGKRRKQCNDSEKKRFVVK